MLTVYLVVAFCVFSDLYMIKVRWNLVQMEDMLFVWCSALTGASALNIPLSIAGIVLKRYHQGMCGRKEKNLTMILSIIIFTIAYVCNFAFIWVTRNLVFEIGAASTLVDNAAAATSVQNNQSMIYAPAFYSAVMPLLTSLTAFVISYFAYDPLGTMIKRYRKELVGIDNHVKDIETALAEATDSEEFRERLISIEGIKREHELKRLDDENQIYKQESLEILAESMSTPSQNGKIAKYIEELMEAYKKKEGKNHE